MTKIACIGNSTKDCLVHTKEENPIITDQRNDLSDETICVGGPANNAAYVIKKFGNQTFFIGQVGDDEYGNFIVQEMKKEGINISMLNICPKLVTPHSTIILSKNQKTGEKERTIFTYRDEKDKKIHKQFHFLENEFDTIITDGKYLKETLQIFKANPNAIKVIDAGRVNDNVVTICNYVDYLVCSEDFAVGYLKSQGSYLGEDKINILNKQLYTNLFFDLQFQFLNSKLIITIGKNGCMYSENYPEVKIIPPLQNLNVIDVNGAGDIFHGAFVHAITNNYNLKEALLISNITASLSTENVGGRNSVPNPNLVFNIFNTLKEEKKKSKIKTKD